MTPAPKTVDQVVYHSLNDGEFFVYCESGQVEKWRKDKSIPLVDVVQAFSIFESSTGSHQGTSLKPSKAKLANAFGTEDETVIISKILSDGKIQKSKGASSKGGDHHAN